MDPWESGGGKMTASSIVTLGAKGKNLREIFPCHDKRSLHFARFRN
jgi:hypothetical protein